MGSTRPIFESPDDSTFIAGLLRFSISKFPDPATVLFFRIQLSFHSYRDHCSLFDSFLSSSNLVTVHCLFIFLILILILSHHSPLFPFSFYPYNYNGCGSSSEDECPSTHFCHGRFYCSISIRWGWKSMGGARNGNYSFLSLDNLISSFRLHQWCLFPIELSWLGEIPIRVEGFIHYYICFFIHSIIGQHQKKWFLIRCSMKSKVLVIYFITIDNLFNWRMMEASKTFLLISHSIRNLPILMLWSLWIAM